MADLQKPAPAKRNLPFKRTVKQKPPSETSAPMDDDGLALFSQSKTYFPTVIEDQQKRAREKAERERQEKEAREREEEEEKARDAQSKRDRLRKQLEKETKHSDSTKKRPRYSPLSNDERQERNDGTYSDDSSTDKPAKRRGSNRDPSTSRSSQVLENSPPARTTQLARQPDALVVLDSSDEEELTEIKSKSALNASRSPPNSNHNKGASLDIKERGKLDDSDSELEVWGEKKDDKANAEGGGEEEDPSEFYIKAAMERRRKAGEARLARESSAAGGLDNNKSNTPGATDDDRGVPVSIMIVAPMIPDAKALCCTVRTTQALQIAFDTYKERLKTQTKHPHQILSELVFTWRGDRVYPTTKLETLGICPRGQDGHLHDNVHNGRAPPEGYMGRDKVYFEAWRPEEYEENQQKRERERKRREMGEWWAEDDAPDNAPSGSGRAGAGAETESKSSQKEEDRVRVIFKAKDMPPRNVTLRQYSTVAHMIKAFRRLAGIAEDKHIEIRWDGEVLDLETTVQDADIADMDSVEVHIR